MGSILFFDKKPSMNIKTDIVIKIKFNFKKFTFRLKLY